MITALRAIKVPPPKPLCHHHITCGCPRLCATFMVFILPILSRFFLHRLKLISPVREIGLELSHGTVSFCYFDLFMRHYLHYHSFFVIHIFDRPWYFVYTPASVSQASVLFFSRSVHKSHKFLVFDQRGRECPSLEPGTFRGAVTCSTDCHCRLRISILKYL